MKTGFLTSLTTKKKNLIDIALFGFGNIIRHLQKLKLVGIFVETLYTNVSTFLEMSN